MFFPRVSNSVFRICLCIFTGLLFLLPISAQELDESGSLEIHSACSPCELHFGNVTVGSSSTLPTSVTNDGTQKITLVGMTRTNAQFVSNLNFPLTLVPGQTIRFAVTFQPQHKGSVNAALHLMNRVGRKLEFHVSGVGVANGALAMNPPSLSFGNVPVGSTASKSETLTNNGGSTLTITKAVVSGRQFSVSGINLPLSLDPHHSYTFKVSYRPTDSGSDSANVTFTYGGGTAKLPLSGTGIDAGRLVVSPATIDFGQVSVGENKTLAGSLKASGATVKVSSATLSDSRYALSGLRLPVTIKAGQSIPYSITFTPKDTGRVTANASFASDASNSPEEQSLTAIGVKAHQHSVALAWDPSSSDVVGYNVYRGKTRGGPYNRINKKVDPNTWYSDKTVIPGTTYYYVTTAVDSKGMESTYSNEVKAAIPKP